MQILRQENKERATGMLNNGASQREIAARFGVHVSTINGLGDRFRATGIVIVPVRSALQLLIITVTSFYVIALRRLRRGRPALFTEEA